MRKSLISCLTVLVVLVTTIPALAQKKYTTKQLNDAGQIVCVWKKGQANAALAQLKQLGLEVVFKPPQERFAACRSGKLTEEQVAKLKELPAIEFVEPDVKLIVERDDSKKDPPINNEMLLAYEHAGRMVCFWKDGKKEEVKKFVKQLGLNIEFAPPREKFIQCSWKSPLKKETLQQLAKSDLLEFVEPDVSLLADKAHQGRIIELPQGVVRFNRSPDGLQALPDDPDLAKLWGMKKIKAYEAWSKANSTDVVVAVIDSGFDYNHPDLKANIWTNTGEIPGNGIDDDKNGHIDDFYGQNYTVLKDGEPTGDPIDGDGHGTHVAGTIGGVGNNKIGVVGVNWRVRMMALKVFDNKGGAPYGTALAAAMGYAIRAKTQGGQNVRVMNMSLRWGADSGNLQLKFNEAEKEGIIVVCAAGNLRVDLGEDPKTVDNDQFPQYPASFKNKNVIAVANITEQGELNRGSHYGLKSVHIGAPGTDVWSTVPISKGSYASFTGTSMASPHVAGAVALVWGQPRYKAFNFQSVKQLILDNAQKFPPLEGKSITGGVLDISFLGDKERPVPQPPPPGAPPIIICPPPTFYCPCPPHRHIFYRFRCGRR